MTTKNDSYKGAMAPPDQENLFNALSFLVTQIMNRKWTMTLCLVKTVNGGGLAVPPTVDVQPMVNEVNGYGDKQEHGIIYGLPVFRLQGGLGAIIADPKAGDIGLMACAMRDISTVVANKAVANPGSARTYDPSDGLYIGAFLGAQPEQYVQFTDDGMKIADKNGNTIDLTAAGITITPKSGTPVMIDGDLEVAGDVTADAEVTAGAAVPATSVSLTTHLHTSGGAGLPTSTPTPGT
jgi:hypothetical protein